jgi:hypothetical protein
MKRRQFLSCVAAVGGYSLADAAADTARQDFGIWRRPVSRGPNHVPREREVTGRIEPAGGRDVEVTLTAEQIPDPLVLRVVRRKYPTGAILGYADSDPVQFDGADSNSTVSVTVPRNTRESDPWFYEAYSRHGSGVDGHAYLCESSPYRWATTDGERTRPAERAAGARSETVDEGFERRLDGNDYALAFRWRDVDDTDWRFDYRVRRSTYEAAAVADKGYVETYEKALTSPLSSDLYARLRADARPLRDDGDGDGGSLEDHLFVDSTVASLSAGRRFDLLVTFVQGIEYASDSATRSAYDYHRTVPETLVAGVGDGEDLTYLLAGLLSAGFDCETALLFQPGHVLLGVAPDDVPPLPYEYDPVTVGEHTYVPIEPSLQVPVGRYPPQPIVAVYGDGRWQYHDPDAVIGGADHVLHEWMGRRF